MSVGKRRSFKGRWLVYDSMDGKYDRDLNQIQLLWVWLCHISHRCYISLPTLVMLTVNFTMFILTACDVSNISSTSDVFDVRNKATPFLTLCRCEYFNEWDYETKFFRKTLGQLSNVNLWNFPRWLSHRRETQQVLKNWMFQIKYDVYWRYQNFEFANILEYKFSFIFHDINKTR